MTDKEKRDYYNEISQFGGRNPPLVVFGSMEACLATYGVPETAIQPVKELIEKFIKGERERCLALLKLEQESAKTEREQHSRGGIDWHYTEGWIDALARLKVKFEDKTDE